MLNQLRTEFEQIIFFCTGHVDRKVHEIADVVEKGLQAISHEMHVEVGDAIPRHQPREKSEVPIDSLERLARAEHEATGAAFNDIRQRLNDLATPFMRTSKVFQAAIRAATQVDRLRLWAGIHCEQQFLGDKEFRPYYWNSPAYLALVKDRAPASSGNQRPKKASNNQCKDVLYILT